MRRDRRRARLDDIQRIADALRADADAPAPDLSSAILARVDSQRCFLSRRGRAMVWVGRGAAALTLALVVLGFTLAHRYAPGKLDLVARPTPVSNVIDTVSAQAGEQLIVIRGSLESRAVRPVELASLIEIARPLEAAVHAVTFVGPPASARLDLAYTPDAEPAQQAGPPRVSGRTARVSLSAWPPSGLREALDDRRWHDEEAPLLFGAAAGTTLAPK